MERAPLPPHERPWRHPSELAATQSAALAAEPTSHTTRLVTLASGAMALIAIGALVVSMSPDRDTHDAGGAVPSTVASALLSVPRATAVTVEQAAVAPTPPRVTAVGDGLVGLATAAALRRTYVETETSGWIDAVLHTGDVVQAKLLVGHEVTLGADDVVVVQLSRAADQAVEVATSMPGDDELVLVLTDPPVEVPLDRVHEIGAEDGTPVLDHDGQLVGLCTNDERGPRLVGVASGPDDDTAGSGRLTDGRADATSDDPD